MKNGSALPPSPGGERGGGGGYELCPGLTKNLVVTWVSRKTSYFVTLNSFPIILVIIVMKKVRGFIRNSRRWKNVIKRDGTWTWCLIFARVSKEIEKTQEIFQKEKIYTFQWEKITEFAFHSFLCVQTLLVFWFHSSHKFFMLLCTIDFWFVSIFFNKDIQHFDLYFLPQHIQWCCYKIGSLSILYPNHGISVSNNRHWIMCPVPMNILIEKNVDRWNNTEGSFIQYLRKIFRKNNISYSLIRTMDNL